MSAISLSLLRAQHRLDRVAEQRDARARDRAQRGALVAEDPGIPVAVGADRALDPEVGQHPRETVHRVLEPRILRVRLDPLERGLGARALDLELRHEDRRLAAGALGVHDRPLVREEPEAGEVLDVVGAEEDVPGQARAAHVLEQPSAPVLQLRGRDAVLHRGQSDAKKKNDGVQYIVAGLQSGTVYKAIKPRHRLPRTRRSASSRASRSRRTARSAGRSISDAVWVTKANYKVCSRTSSSRRPGLRQQIRAVLQVERHVRGRLQALPRRDDER